MKKKKAFSEKKLCTGFKKNGFHFEVSYQKYIEIT